jgi:hypothetical protein
MIADCRAGKPEGWIGLVTHFVNPFRTLLKHYGGGEDSLRRFLMEKREVVKSSEPCTNRELITHWRSALLECAGYPRRPVRNELDIEIMQEALAELTALERQMVWFESMEYGVADTAKFMHVAPEAVERGRAKADDMLRGKLDNWWKTIVFDCGPSLGAEARAQVPAEPVAFRDIIEYVDGRLTWQLRSQVDRCQVASWYEVDHFCRVREADEAVGSSHPLSEEEAKPYLELFGVSLPKPSLWKRMLSSR